MKKQINWKIIWKHNNKCEKNPQNYKQPLSMHWDLIYKVIYRSCRAELLKIWLEQTSVKYHYNLLGLDTT